MQRFVLSVGAIAALAIAVAPNAAHGQEPPRSQRGTVTQSLANTVVAVTYDRPSARGRTLFGEDGVVVYDALWTPGANRATILEFDGEVSVAGKPVPSGKYSVWLIPRAGEWTFILNRGWDTNHAIYPGEPDDVLRIPITPTTAEHMETLALYFPVVDGYRAELRIHWGSTAIAVPIEAVR